jgi:hypothetical protein
LGENIEVGVLGENEVEIEEKIEGKKMVYLCG